MFVSARAWPSHWRKDQWAQRVLLGSEIATHHTNPSCDCRPETHIHSNPSKRPACYQAPHMHIGHSTHNGNSQFARMSWHLQAWLGHSDKLMLPRCASVDTQTGLCCTTANYYCRHQGHISHSPNKQQGVCQQLLWMWLRLLMLWLRSM